MHCRDCGNQILSGGCELTLRCASCQSLPAATMGAISADGITPASEISECLCPTCRIPMSCGFLDEEMVEYCHCCHGILFDEEQFAAVVSNRRDQFSGPDSPVRHLDRQQLEVHRCCPVCDETMECHPYYGPGNVVIDHCDHCHIVWLDAGELTLIEEASGRRQRMVY